MNMTGRYKSRTTGLTLIELLVTVAVIAIASAIALPSLTNIIQSNRVSSQTNEIVAMLHLARNEAIRRNDPEDESVFVDLDLSADNKWAGFVRPPDIGSSDVPCAPGAIRCLNRDNVRLILAGASEIRFNNRGYLVDDAGELEASGAQVSLQHVNTTSNRFARCIEISVVGQVTTKDGVCT